MSTLAAARADNFYYPPEWDPSKGSINKGQHPLRERAKKLDQGILVIRFEMPFNFWCAGCGHLIGQGVRFNAEKKAVGNYHSTKIWSFSMTAPCCKQRIEIHTDPKNAQYVVKEGGRQKEEEFTAKDAETLDLGDTEDKARLSDPFYKLEAGNEDKTKAKRAECIIADLLEDADAKFKNDYEINKALRRQLRGARKDEKARDGHRKALGLHESIKLLPEASEDAHTASLISFGESGTRDRNWHQARRAIHKQNIFAQKPLAAAAPRRAAAAVGSAPTASAFGGSAFGAGGPRGGVAKGGAGASQKRSGRSVMDRAAAAAKRSRLGAILED